MKSAEAEAEVQRLKAFRQVKRQARYYSSRLDCHGPDLLQLYNAGAAGIDLCQWLRDHHRIVVAPSTVYRWLKSMTRFSPVESQAKRITRAQHKDGRVKSVGTARNYADGLIQFGHWLETRAITLENSTHALAVQYLYERSEQVGQSALNRDRQAIDHYRADHLGGLEKLPIIKSELDEILRSRAYSPEQLKLIRQHQTPAHALATEIASTAGLRAHELYSLRPLNERSPDARDWESTIGMGLRGNRFTVTGKGGLTRMVIVPYELAERLQALRLAEPRLVTDRTCHYEQFYELKGGQQWSASFSAASKRILGWSRGAHGVRHSYAQQRMQALIMKRLTYEQALRTVSHELGHLRPEITKIYLR